MDANHDMPCCFPALIPIERIGEDDGRNGALHDSHRAGIPGVAEES